MWKRQSLKPGENALDAVLGLDRKLSPFLADGLHDEDESAGDNPEEGEECERGAKGGRHVASSCPFDPRRECGCEDQREHKGDRDDRQAAEQPDECRDHRAHEEHLHAARCGAPKSVAPKP